MPDAIAVGEFFVVFRPFLGVADDAVGVGNFDEAGGGVGVFGVVVGVVGFAEFVEASAY